MALHLHRAARTDHLADALGDLLGGPRAAGADAFAEEVVVVPAKGVERWLTQRLSHRLGVGERGGDGVCAGVRFLSPHSLVSLLLRREHDDPWHPERLVWPLLTTLDESLDEPWCATVARHLGHGLEGEEGEVRRSRRYSVAIRLAGLFARYAHQRPTLVSQWREGRLGHDTDGAGEPLADDLAWQPELWRRVLQRVGEQPPDVRHAATLARLEAGDTTLDLPARLSLFGHTRLARTDVDLLGALGRHRDVHLWLPQPSPALWTALADLPAGDGLPAGPVPRSLDTSAELVGHPLLASLGRDARELHRTLAPASAVEAGPVAQPQPRSDTLLGCLQADIVANRAPDAAARAGREPRPDDRSLQVHACHGPARQVEVLREVLVGLLADDPTLEPRDILVMCPDIETFAPLVSAGFGLAPGAPAPGEHAQEPAGHPAHRLRVRLADRALTSTNPLLAVAEALLGLAGGRVTASEVLDLAAREPVRRRFALSDDDLDRVARWIGEAGVRWGLDASGRAPFAMQRFEHNTWRAGVDRVLLGVAMSGDEHRHLGRGLPLDDVGSGEIELAGRLGELLHRLGECLAALQGATAVEQWTERLRHGVLALADVDPDDAWQVPQLERELVRAAAGGTGDEGAPGVGLRLADVRSLLDSRLAGRPTRANFRTGTLTVCTMTPMRSVPHRVVCLLGLDDGVFPRSLTPDGDDALARRPLTGEHDPRSEDRQLVLDALLAATEHLVVTYTGANEHSGAERPPAVPLGEILDAADRTAARPVRDHVLVRHPLQPHDPRNLAPGGLVAGERPFSFDRAALDGALAARGPRTAPRPLLARALPARPTGDLTLADLEAFFAHPVRSLLRGRLDVSTPFEPDEVSDAIPVDLDGLALWKIGDQLLAEVVAGHDPEAVMHAEQLRGTLPPGRLGEAQLGVVTRECQALLAATADLRAGEARSIDVDVDLGDGRRLTGTVAGVRGSRVLSLGYSRLKPKQRLAAWIRLLALSASRPDEHWTSHAVGRERSGPKRALAGPLDHRAGTWLRQLVGLYDLGHTVPLPLPPLTAAAWAEARARELTGADADPAAAAEREWRTDPHHRLGIRGEDADPYHQRVFGSAADLGVLLDAGLGQHAWTVWEPLLAGAERVAPL